MLSFGINSIMFFQKEISEGKRGEEMFMPPVADCMDIFQGTWQYGECRVRGVWLKNENVKLVLIMLSCFEWYMHPREWGTLT